MKKIVLVLLMVFGVTLVNAQSSSGTKWLKLGGHIGVPVSDSSDWYSMVAGVDLKYQLLGIDSFGIGFATGVSNYFGKEKKSIKIPNLSFVPLAGLFRYYSTSSFFIGADLGYAFMTKKDSKGGFYYRPEIGYHSELWNIYGFYQGISREYANISSVGIGVSYNIVRRKR